MAEASGSTWKPRGRGHIQPELPGGSLRPDSGGSNGRDARNNARWAGRATRRSHPGGLSGRGMVVWTLHRLGLSFARFADRAYGLFARNRVPLGRFLGRACKGSCKTSNCIPQGLIRCGSVFTMWHGEHSSLVCVSTSPTTHSGIKNHWSNTARRHSPAPWPWPGHGCVCKNVLAHHEMMVCSVAASCSATRISVSGLLLMEGDVAHHKVGLEEELLTPAPCLLATASKGVECPCQLRSLHHLHPSPVFGVRSPTPCT